MEFRYNSYRTSQIRAPEFRPSPHEGFISDPQEPPTPAHRKLQ